MAEAANTESLVGRAKRGDQVALAALIGRIRQQVFRWALVMTGDSDDAEDIAQQVSLNVHRKLSQFDERARFTTWLYTIVRNQAFELTRKASRRRETPIVEDEMPGALTENMEDQLSRIGNQETARLVRAFFTELPPRQRELIELIDTEGCSAAQAAEMMGIEPETARGHLMRARRILRAKMLALHPELIT